MCHYLKTILITATLFATAGCGLDASITDLANRIPISEKASNTFEPISGKAPKEITLRGYEIEQSVGYPLSERHVKTARGYSFTFGSDSDSE